MLLAFRPDGGEGEPVVVTMRDGEETTWLGRPASADYIRRAWDQDVAPAGVSALLAAFQLQVFDPE